MKFQLKSIQLLCSLHVFDNKLNEVSDIHLFMTINAHPVQTERTQTQGGKIEFVNPKQVSWTFLPSLTPLAELYSPFMFYMGTSSTEKYSS